MYSEGEKYLAERIRELSVFREFAGFVKRAAGDKSTPELRDLDLMSEYQLARNIYIFDVLKDTPSLWIRYVGTNICDFFGFDTTGRFMENLNFEENFDQTIAGYRTVAREKAPYAFLNYISFQEPKLTALKKDRLFVMIRLAFPLVDAQGDVVNIVGAMDFIDVEVAPKERFVQLPFSEIADVR